MWLHGYEAMWLCGHVAVWLCAFVAMWLCGYVASKFRGVLLERRTNANRTKAATCLINALADARIHYSINQFIYLFIIHLCTYLIQ